MLPRLYRIGGEIMVVFCARIRKTRDINGIVGVSTALRAASAAGRGLGRAGVAGIARIAGLIGFKFIFVFVERVALVDRLKYSSAASDVYKRQLQIIHELVFIERLEDDMEDSLVAGGFQPRRVLEIGDQK